jgi:hypothetical protein
MDCLLAVDDEEAFLEVSDRDPKCRDRRLIGDPLSGEFERPFLWALPSAGPSSPLFKSPDITELGSNLDLSRDMYDGLLIMGAVICVIGPSLIPKSSMLTRGLSSCSYKTSSLPMLSPARPFSGWRVIDCAETCLRNVP